VNNTFFPKRNRPNRGVLIKENEPTLAFVTICTKNRKPWLATDLVHGLLRNIWTEASYWKVGSYVIMPNHVHFFAWPGRLYADIDDWVQYWKATFTKRSQRADWRWQRASFHHRIRSDESAEARRVYMLQNPVRAGLVEKESDWPYTGELFKPGAWW
jgi:putative transposase